MDGLSNKEANKYAFFLLSPPQKESKLIVK